MSDAEREARELAERLGLFVSVAHDGTHTGGKNFVGALHVDGLKITTGRTST